MFWGIHIRILAASAFVAAFLMPQQLHALQQDPDIKISEEEHDAEVRRAAEDRRRRQEEIRRRIAEEESKLATAESAMNQARANFESFNAQLQAALSSQRQAAAAMQSCAYQAGSNAYYQCSHLVQQEEYWRNTYNNNLSRQEGLRWELNNRVNTYNRIQRTLTSLDRQRSSL